MGDSTQCLETQKVFPLLNSHTVTQQRSARGTWRSGLTSSCNHFKHLAGNSSTWSSWWLPGGWQCPMHFGSTTCRAGVQRAENSVGCEGKAEATSSPCSCPGILSWTTKPHHPEPLSDQSKEGGGCPGMGMARLALAGASWQQGWGWDFLGPLPSVPFQIWVSPLPETISTPFISQGLGEKGKKVLSKVFPFPSKV